VRSAPARFAPTSGGAFAGERVAFLGTLGCLSRAEARALVRRLGGDVAAAPGAATTLLVVGEREPPAASAAGRSLAAARRGAWPRLRVLDEAAFCERAGVTSTAELRDRYHSLREIRRRFPHLREDRIRYLETWGLVQPARVTRGDRWYTFDHLARLAELNRRLEAGASLRAAVRDLVAEREGQLGLDLRPRTPGVTVLAFPGADPGEAEILFARGAELEGLPGGASAAARAYEEALRVDPGLVPALINLANLHYLDGDLERARELYGRAAALAAEDWFQIPFNLANIAHDRGRYAEAERLYRRAVELEPGYADAHFYLALTLEKLGRSADAKPHWRAYRTLEPRGEWVRLAREMERE
jgi:tetratricopeptide (TPR) repeat protein